MTNKIIEMDIILTSNYRIKVPADTFEEAVAIFNKTLITTGWDIRPGLHTKGIEIELVNTYGAGDFGIRYVGEYLV